MKDDTNLLQSGNSIKNLVSVDLAIWLNANKVSLVGKKTEMIKSKRKNVDKVKIKWSDKIIYPAKNVKHLDMGIYETYLVAPCKWHLC